MLNSGKGSGLAVAVDHMNRVTDGTGRFVGVDELTVERLFKLGDGHLFELVGGNLIHIGQIVAHGGRQLVSIVEANPCINQGAGQNTPEKRNFCAVR